jgi:hypothetical protein
MLMFRTLDGSIDSVVCRQQDTSAVCKPQGTKYDIVGIVCRLRDVWRDGIRNDGSAVCKQQGTYVHYGTVCKPQGASRQATQLPYAGCRLQGVRRLSVDCRLQDALFHRKPTSTGLHGAEQPSSAGRRTGCI